MNFVHLHRRCAPVGDELRSSSRTSSLERVRKNFNSFDFANAHVGDERSVHLHRRCAPVGDELRSSSRFANAHVNEIEI